MNIFQSDHIDILKVLVKHDVRFILIGGVAVNFYGFNRPTGDLDVWIDPTDKNKEMLIKALNELEIVDEDVQIIKGANFSKPFVFHIGTKPPFVVDFLTKIVGVTWNEAWEMRIEDLVEDISVSFIHINHLKANKLLAGRAKDLEDIRQLNRIEELRRK